MLQNEFESCRIELDKHLYKNQYKSWLKKYD